MGRGLRNRSPSRLPRDVSTRKRGAGLKLHTSQMVLHSHDKPSNTSQYDVKQAGAATDPSSKSSATRFSAMIRLAIATSVSACFPFASIRAGAILSGTCIHIRRENAREVFAMSDHAERP